jgi:hypothetical protein
MGEKLDDRELFKRLAKPGEQFDDDWVDALHEKVRDEGVLVGEKQWNRTLERVPTRLKCMRSKISFLSTTTPALMAPTKRSPTLQTIACS